MGSILNEFIDAFSRFARFEEWLVGRQSVPLRSARIADRYDGLERPAYQRRRSRLLTRHRQA
jgi:hypothetical protein